MLSHKLQIQHNLSHLTASVLLDSGATHHVTGNPNIISDIHQVHHSPMLDATGKAHPVVGKGKVFIQLPDREIKCIDNVLYVPSVHRNLLSVGCIANQSYTLEFVKSTCIIWDMHTRQIFAKAEKLGNRGLYQLKAQSIINTVICSLEQHKTVKTALLWHRRLSHLNFDSLHKLFTERTVKGLPKLSQIHYICDICQSRKQTRKKFSKSHS
jgi:hypothetical protein